MFIKQLTAQLNAIRLRARQLLVGLSPAQLTRRPDPTRWSIAECVVHLNMSAADYLPLIAAAIDKAKRENLTGNGPFNPGWMGRFLINSMEPPPKRRFKAPEKIAHPVPVGDDAKLLADFLKTQDELERLAKEAEGLNLEKIKIQSPYAWWLRLRLCAVFPFVFAHERRHLWQAEQVKRQLALM